MRARTIQVCVAQETDSMLVCCGGRLRLIRLFDCDAMSDDALEEDIHPSLSLPDFCPVPVCFNVRERAFRAVDVPPNAISINTLKSVDCLREPAPTPLFKI